MVLGADQEKRSSHTLSCLIPLAEAHFSDPAMGPESLLESILVVNKVLCTAKARWNGYLPVSGLGQDLLLEIFRWLRAETCTMKFAQEDNRSESWIAAMQVCREWRRISLEYAPFWNTLSLDGRMRRIPFREILSRSKEVPITVTLLAIRQAGDDIDSLASIFEDVVENHSHRINILFVQSDVISQFIYPILRHDFAILRQLEISNSSPLVSNLDPSPDIARRMPQLDSLYLVGLTLDRPIAPFMHFSCLSRLYLNFQGLENSDIYYGVFDLLVATPELRAIQIDGKLPRDPYPYWTDTLALPSGLQQITLSPSAIRPYDDCISLARKLGHPKISRHFRVDSALCAPLIREYFGSSFPPSNIMIDRSQDESHDPLHSSMSNSSKACCRISTDRGDYTEILEILGYLNDQQHLLHDEYIFDNLCSADLLSITYRSSSRKPLTIFSAHASHCIWKSLSVGATRATTVWAIGETSVYALLSTLGIAAASEQGSLWSCVKTISLQMSEAEETYAIGFGDYLNLQVYAFARHESGNPIETLELWDSALEAGKEAHLRRFVERVVII